MVHVVRVERHNYMYEVEAVDAETAKIYGRWAYNKGAEAKDSWADEETITVNKATNLERWMHKE